MAWAGGIWSGGGGVCSVFEPRKKKRETEWEREEDGEFQRGGSNPLDVSAKPPNMSTGAKVKRY